MVIKPTEERTKCRSIKWLCQCDCGNITKVSTNNLVQNITFSCGCLKQSHGAFLIEKFLQEHNIKFKKEYTFYDLKSPNKGTLRFDFAIFDKNNNLIQLLEYDGEFHFPQFINESTWNTSEKY